MEHVSEAVERIAPSPLAEGWDNCGLQVGDPAARVSRVLVALTPLPEVFEEAEEKGADFLLFHHPLLFDPIRTLSTSSYPGNLVARAIRNGLAVYAAHTSYDAAPAGVSVALAQALGLRGPLRVIAPRGAVRKLVVFVPEESVETVVPAHAAERAAQTAAAAHPYEEVALDVYPVEGSPEGCGYGRLGNLPGPLTSEGLRERVSGSLGFPARLVADTGRRIERVAVLGGSGGSFIREVAASGAHAYVTGDVDYHGALLAESLGLSVVEAGHAATELPSLGPLAGRLAELVDVPVEVSRVRR